MVVTADRTLDSRFNGGNSRTDKPHNDNALSRNSQTQQEKAQALVLWFEDVGMNDVSLAGGKNASLGEMIQQLIPQGINVPGGFATIAHAYRYFIKQAGLEIKLRQLFADLDVASLSNLRSRGRQARALILNTPFPEELNRAITFDKLKDGTEKMAVAHQTIHYPNKPDFFIDKLARGIATIAAAFYSKPVIVRMSDFKSNEYANLLGGKQFEPTEENPMLGGIHVHHDRKNFNCRRSFPEQ